MLPAGRVVLSNYGPHFVPPFWFPALGGAMTDTLFQMPKNAAKDDWLCRDCEQWAPENARAKAGVAKDGQQLYFRLCMPCKNRAKNATRGRIPDTYRAAKMIEQRGCCAICREHVSTLDGGMQLDHNHQTGELRGLLCNNCNSALGKTKENPEIIKAMADYLKRFSMDETL